MNQATTDSTYSSLDKHDRRLLFVRIWNLSDSMAKVCERLGLSRGPVAIMASSMRKRGIKLKEHPDEKKPVRKTDWEAVAKAAEATLGEDDVLPGWMNETGPVS